MLKAFLNVRTVRSAQLVEKGFLIGGGEPDYLKNLLSRISYFLQVLVGNGLYTYRYWSQPAWTPKTDQPAAVKALKHSSECAAGSLDGFKADLYKDSGRLRWVGLQKIEVAF